MKKALFILSSLSMAFPLISLARTVPALKPAAPPVVGKPSALPAGQGKAFPTAPLREIGNCGTACAQAAEDVLSRKTVKAINGLNPQAEDVHVVTKMLNAAPGISARLGNEGMPQIESRQIANALATAGVKAVEEKWDIATRANLEQFTQSLVANGQNGVDPNQLAEVKANCVL